MRGKVSVAAALLSAVVGMVVGCRLELEAAPKQATVARFDTTAGVIPMPSDVVFDDEAGVVSLPIEDDMTPAEQEFRAFLNEGDGFSTAFPAKVDFSAPIDPASVTPERFQLWDMSAQPKRLAWAWEAERPAGYEGPVARLDDAHTQLIVDAPRAGWRRGGRYMLFVRGGADGVRDAAGGPVDVDKAFYFLRLRQKLDAYENQRAFPGDTRDARLETAGKLEALRLELDPFFAFLESTALPAAERVAREDIVALWTFHVTTRNELAMDRASQRVPLPFDLLIEPDTGKVELTPAPWDDALERDAKLQLNELDGFGVSANLFFETTQAVDPTTVDAQSVTLYRLDAPFTEVPLAEVRVMADAGVTPCQQTPPAPDCRHLVLVPEDAALPLEPRTSYAVVVSKTVRSADGGPVVPMLIGHFMRAPSALYLDGQSQIASLPDDLAARLEGTRSLVAPLLDYLGRNDVVTAWPFTTLDVEPDVAAHVHRADTLALPVEPTVTSWKTLDAFNRDEPFESLFPGALAQAVRDVYALRLGGVARVIEGTLPSPYYLDRETRRFRADGGYELEDVKFVMTVPETATAANPAPVVVFAHAVVTDRRFVLTIAGELAQRGLAAIAIDLPFHGDRIACVESSLVAIPNFLSQELRDLLGYYDNLIMLPPCVSGDAASCSADGKCLDANGDVEPFNSFLMLAGKPAVMDVKPASGAAFLDINDIPYIKDHFLQALVDLGTVRRSLQQADWTAATGYPIRKDRIHFAGQSLGAILGAVYVAFDQDIERAVLNVPGADMVDLFMESTYFSPQFEDFFVREQIPQGSFRQERLLDVARWLIDSVDPQAVAHLYHSNGNPTLLQIDSGAPGGDIVIPNRTTRVLQRVSGLPMREYASILHGDLVIPVLGDAMLNDMAAFLAGEISQ
ncbi:MAG: hypothetical protein IT373_06785 [Polyangiaceae bacterium]|nr:hypothetical protein [Polyangiaceae bacterium]